MALRVLRFLAREQLQQPFNFGGGSDLLRQLVSGRFCALIWRQRCVMQLWLQVHAMVWYWDGRCLYVNGW